MKRILVADTGRSSKRCLIHWKFNQFSVVKGQNSFVTTLVAGLLVAGSRLQITLRRLRFVSTLSASGLSLLRKLQRVFNLTLALDAGAGQWSFQRLEESRRELV